MVHTRRHSLTKRAAVLACLGAALAAGAVGQPRPQKKASTAEVRKHVDPVWFRKSLVEDNLTHWLAAAPTPNGFFQVSLDRQWKPYAKQVGTLVSQPRQLFVMAAGYRVTRDPAYREAARKGAEFMLEHFRDKQYGGWFAMVGPDGAVLDTHKNAYGHAFVIFGLSHAWQATRDERFRKAALQTWEEMKTKMRDKDGFIRPQAARDFSQMRGPAEESPLFKEFRAVSPPAGAYPPSTINNQNPMMHLFEALLALHDATGLKTVLKDAEELASNIFTKLFQEREGYLPEMFDENWKPLPPEKRGYIEIGHQMEWAYLLSRGVEKGLPAKFLAIGERLLEYGMKGYDAENGGLFSRGNYQGGISRDGKSWWEQCETLRCMMHWAALRGRGDLWGPFDKSLEFVKQDFIDSEYGGWYASYNPKIPRDERRAFKGSIGKIGYHDSGMYLEGLRLSGALR